MRYEKPKKEYCVWEFEDEGFYQTTCDNGFTLNDGSWEDNSFIYCPYCGKEITNLQPEDLRD